MSSIKWNPEVKLVLSDVDETVADLYLPAAKEMILQLTDLLEKGIVIFFITGQGTSSIRNRIVNFIPGALRTKILMGHCSGAEVWGFEKDGSLQKEPYYSVSDEKLDEGQKLKFREVVKNVLSKFELKVHQTMPIQKFVNEVSNNPLSILYEDRGPQITFEMPNAYDLTEEQINELEHEIPNTHGHYDLRIPIVEYSEKLFKNSGLPITPRLGGEFAIDFAVEGVSKTTAVQKILGNENILNSVGLSLSDIKDPVDLEIWGDKFSVIRGGTDRHMCEAVDPAVRAIDFRLEEKSEFLKGYNIVVWDGQKHLHDGLLEFLESGK